jgi:putative ABC transport system permease protein
MINDIRYALRMLAKNPGFTFVALLTLALGIGANTAIFSLVESILLRPLPYRQPEQLVRLVQSSPELGLPVWGVSQAGFAAYRDQNRSFEALAIYTSGGTNLTGAGEPERLSVSNVTADFFKVLGVNPVAGRTFQDGEDAPGKNSVCVISYGLWQRRFAADPNAIGQKLTLNNAPVEIVGIMPSTFKYPRAEIDLWIPLALDANRTAPYFGQVIGRLKPDVTQAQAQAHTTDIVQNFGRQHPKTSEAVGLDKGNGPRTVITPLKEVVVGKTQKPLLVLLSAVALVLLIACANVANLLLARATARTREMVVRISLGATRARLLRQLLTESVLLAVFGAIAGLALTAYGLKLLDKLPITGIARIEEVRLSGTVLGFTAALTVLTGLLFGFMPALRAYAMGVATGLRDGARGSVAQRHLNSALVAVQFALSLVLLIGAGLLLKSFQRLESVDVGFDPEQTLTMVATLPQTKYDDGKKVLRFYNGALEQLRNSPGIKAAGLTTSLPFGEDGNTDGFIVEGQEPANASETEQAEVLRVTGGTFQALGIPLLQGRDFQDSDNSDTTPVAIIDETLARRYWPANDAVGRRIQTTGDQEWLTIVGVVGGIKQASLSEEKYPHLYMSMSQAAQPRATFVVRTDGPAQAAFATFRAAIKQVDPDIPFQRVRLMTDRIGETLSTQRLTNMLLTGFAVVALLLAAVGIYSTMSLYVGSRTKEFGIRLALGAQPRALVRTVLRQGMSLTAAGVVVGLAGAFALTRAIRSLLYEVSPTDPWVFVTIPLLLGIVALVACYMPARRATQVDPLVALKEE